jgi:hypothetical protein
MRLIANAMVGLVLLFVTNLFLSDDVPVNLLTLVICAIGGCGMAGNHDPPPARGGLLKSCTALRWSMPDATYPRLLAVEISLG